MKLLPRVLLTAAFSALAFGPTLPQVRAQSDQSILLLDPGGHTNQVRQALFTPFGKEVISVGEDKVIRVWDTQTGKQIGAIHGQIGRGLHDKLMAATLSHDGKTLAVAGNTYEGDLSAESCVYIRLYHLDDLRAQPIAVTMTLLPTDTAVKVHTHAVEALMFSPTDDNMLASADVGGTVCVWNTQTGKPVWDSSKMSEDQHSGVVYSLAWSPDGRHIASASDDKTVHIRDAQSGKMVKAIGYDHLARSVAWSPNGKFVAVGTGGGEIFLYNADGFHKVASWKQEDTVSSLAFSPDNQALVSGLEGADPQFPVTVWSVPGGRKIGGFDKHDANVTSIAFSRDGKTVLSAGGRSNDIYLWNWPGATQVQHLVGTGGEASQVAWSEQEGTNGQPPIYQLEWKSKGGTQSHIFDFGTMQLATKLYDPTWTSAVTQNGGRSLRVNEGSLSISVSGGEKEVSFPPPSTTDLDPQTKRVDLDAQTDYIFKSGNAAEHSYSFLPKGDAVVLGSRYTLALYATADGRLLRKFRGHTGYITSVSVSPDGKYLASASSDQTVAIWPLPRVAPDSEPIKPLLQLYAGADSEHSNSDEFIVWNPEFGYYASSPAGQQMIGWQANNGEDQMANYITGASSYSSRENSQVIRLMMRKGAAVAAILEAGDKPDPPVQDAPSIRIVAPDAGTSINQETTEVKVEVTSDKNNPVSSVSISVNKHPYLIPFPKDGSAPEHFKREGDRWVGVLSVTLRRGCENTLTALAVGADNLESAPAKVKMTSLLPRKTSHRLNLLAIGIAEYDRFVDLSYPDADAKEVAQFFEKQQGRMFSKVDVTLLTNEQATKANIQAALKSLVEKGRSLDDDDYTIVFVAGHGGATEDSHRYYLMPSDVETSSPKSVQETAIEFSELSQALNQQPGNVIFLMDACHSGGTGAGTNEGYAAVMSSLQNRVIQGDSPIISFLSCKANETSQEEPRWQHGAFTRALLDGLQGAADRDKDGSVDVDELSRYLNRRVDDLVANGSKPDKSQSPQVYGVEGFSAGLRLAQVPAAVAANPNAVTLPRTVAHK